MSVDVSFTPSVSLFGNISTFRRFGPLSLSITLSEHCSYKQLYKQKLQVFIYICEFDTFLGVI